LHSLRSKRLRSLPSDTLPLRVVAVQPLAPVLRHAAAFPPLPQLLAGAPADAVRDHAARCLQPVELLCQLEGSGGVGGVTGGKHQRGPQAVLAAAEACVLCSARCSCCPIPAAGVRTQLPAGPLPRGRSSSCAGKWPDQPEAFSKMRAAVGCQLAQQLHTALGLEAQVGAWGGGEAGGRSKRRGGRGGGGRGTGGGGAGRMGCAAAVTRSCLP
jgi:uncharacterized protein (DUF2249 family)